MEAATGLSFGPLYQHFGLTAELAVALFYFSLFIVIFVTDLNHQLILSRIAYPAVVIASLINIFTAKPGFPNGLLGGGVEFIVLLIPAFAFCGGMG